MASFKSLLSEFKQFAFQGNMLDLAVAVVIGAAFGDVIKSLSNDIIMGAVTSIGGGDVTGLGWAWRNIHFGAFLGALLHFLIIAAAVFFFVVKIIGGAMKKLSAPPPAPSEPVTKECPMCCSVIPIKAVRCPQCTSDLSPGATPARA